MINKKNYKIISKKAYNLKNPIIKNKYNIIIFKKLIVKGNFNLKNLFKKINILKLFNNINHKQKVKTLIDEKYLLCCNFNYKLPGQVDKVQYGEVLNASLKPKIIKQEDLKKGFITYFSSLQNQKEKQNNYSGYYLEEINNKYVLKHTSK